MIATKNLTNGAKLFMTNLMMQTVKELTELELEIHKALKVKPEVMEKLSYIELEHGGINDKRSWGKSIMELFKILKIKSIWSHQR